MYLLQLVTTALMSVRGNPSEGTMMVSDTTRDELVDLESILEEERTNVIVLKKRVTNAIIGRDLESLLGAAEEVCFRRRCGRYSVRAVPIGESTR